MSHVGIVTAAVAGTFMVLAAQVDPDHPIGPMEAAGPAPAVGDRVVIAPVPTGWVIIGVLPAL